MKFFTLSSLLIILSVKVTFSQFGATIEICNTGTSHTSIHPIDFDNDGDIDFLTTDGATGNNFGNDYNNFYINTITAQNFGLCENVGSNAFVYHTLFDLGQQEYWAFGDLSGDGLPDLIHAETYGNASNGTSYGLFYQENLGSFAFGVDQLIYSLDVSDEINIWDFWFNRISIGDADSDGDQDIVVLFNGIPGDPDTYVGQDNIYKIEYNAGVFAGPVLLASSNNTYGACGCPGDVSDMLITDLNQDGWNDILFQRIVGDGNEMIVHTAVGAGIFEDDAYWQLYSYSWDIADMQNDGQNNLIGIDPFASYIEVGDPDLGWSLSPSIDVVDYTAPGLAAIDIDTDLDCDVIFPSTNGILNIIFQDDSWITSGNTTFPVVHYDTGITNNVSSLVKTDYNQDGIKEMVVMAEGHVYIIPLDIVADQFATLHLNGFIDDNQNDLFDFGEQPFYSFQADLTNSNNAVQTHYTNTGQINIQLEPDQYILNLNDVIGAYNVGGSFPINLDLSDASADITIDIPFIPDNDPVTEMSLSLFSWPGVCNSTSNVYHFISSQNIGSLVANGSLTYQLDPLHQFISATPTPTTISGNTITWDFSGIMPTQLLQFSVLVTPVNTADIGLTAFNTATVTLMDGGGITSFDYSVTDSYLVTCSYDPNDITETNGHTDAGYVLDGSELQYTIRFQNTGNAPASNVRIENDLNDLLQRSTLQPVAWSHDFLLSIDENNLGTFYLNDINLPDSISDESGSHGFVTYRILPVTGLDAGTEIPNTASIYFDFNPAIVTNTEINTIYDCVDLEQASISATTICAGETIECSNEAIWIESLEWSFDNALLGENNYTHTLNESGTLTMNVSNSLCTYSQNWELSAWIVDAAFNVSGNLLTASEGSSYQWYLNGNAIANATAQTYPITETGNYSVEVTDANGCSDISESMQVTYTSVEESNEAPLLLYPNPVKDIIHLQFNASFQPTGVLCIVDITGRICMSITPNGKTNLQVDCSKLDNGIYVILHEGKQVGRFVKK